MGVDNLDDDLRNRAMHVEALLLRVQGKLNDARTIFRTILDRVADTENSYLIATETMNIGATYLDAGDTEQAIPYFEKAEKLSAE